MNHLRRIVQRINRLPQRLRPWVLSRAFGHTIPFTASAGVRVVELGTRKAMLCLPNRRRARNHIGTIHATATALLAESATGILLAMHVDDDCVPVLKSLHVDYLRRSQGALQATATLDSASIDFIRTHEHGEISVPVAVTDAAGQSPVQAQLLWAWVPRRQ